MADEQQAQETFTNVQPIEQKSAVSTPAAQPNQAQETFTNVKPVAKAPKASPAPVVTSNPAEPKPAGLLDTVGAVAHNVHNISSAMDNNAPADITPQQQAVAEVGKGVRAAYHYATEEPKAPKVDQSHAPVEAQPTAPGAPVIQRPTINMQKVNPEIGRASCRERVSSPV